MQRRLRSIRVGGKMFPVEITEIAVRQVDLTDEPPTFQTMMGND